MLASIFSVLALPSHLSRNHLWGYAVTDPVKATGALYDAVPAGVSVGRNLQRIGDFASCFVFLYPQAFPSVVTDVALASYTTGLFLCPQAFPPIGIQDGNVWSVLDAYTFLCPQALVFGRNDIVPGQTNSNLFLCPQAFASVVTNSD